MPEVQSSAFTRRPNKRITKHERPDKRGARTTDKCETESKKYL